MYDSAWVDGLIEKKHDSAVSGKDQMTQPESKKKQHLQRLNRENFQVVRKAMAELGSLEHGHYTVNIGNVSLPQN